MLSIKDIARIAGVSVSTVSRVMNNKPSVKADKRERVLRVIEETGFVPNRAARDIVLKQTSKVGILLPDTFNQFQRQLFSEVAHNVESYGYYTNFIFISSEDSGEEEVLHKLKSERLDGIVQLKEIELPEFCTYVEQQEIPVIHLTFEIENFMWPTHIHISDRLGAKEATNYLISLGHSDIAFIVGRKFSFGTHREQGYKEALQEHGIRYNQDLTSYVDSYTMREGKRATEALLQRNIPFSALFATSDDLAIGAIRQLVESGLNVPEDVSVIGVDNIEFSEYTDPSLTTIEQPIKEMGKLAVELLHKRIIGKEEPTMRNIVIPYTLIERESTKRK
ncbi:MAG: LacI family DNA-binding transcriptional regulator [Sphaerochaetaceae bacterium]|jgi:LacI family transcriptional regulator